MLLYRIEHPNPYQPENAGPFHHGNWTDRKAFERWRDYSWCGAFNAGGLYPTPYADKIDHERRDLFACPCRASLDHWFGMCYDDLSDNGFVVAVYDVPDESLVLRGQSGTQVTFDPDGAFRRMTIDPREFEYTPIDIAA